MGNERVCMVMGTPEEVTKRIIYEYLYSTSGVFRKTVPIHFFTGLLPSELLWQVQSKRKISFKEAKIYSFSGFM